MKLDDLLDWRKDGEKPMPELIEDRSQRAEKLTEMLNQAVAYWAEVAPCGKAFTVEGGMELLLYDAKRFAAGLTRIMRKADEQKALIDHRAATGQEETETDRQRWFAYLDVANVAREVLSAAVPAAFPENSDQEQP